MKSILSYLVLITFLTAPTSYICGQRKSKKQLKLEEFAKITEIVKEKQFRFVADRAFPMQGRSIDLTTNYGFIDIEGNKSKGDLPYFGRAYSLAYGGDGGINFDNKIQNEAIEINEKKKRINFRFEVAGENDAYRINMDIFYNGKTSVSITSNNRSHIS